MTDTAPAPTLQPAAAGGGPFGFLPDDPRTRNFTIAGIVVALLLFLFVASRLLFGGGGGSGETAAPTTVPGAAPVRTTTTRPAAGAAESFEVFSTKNPFTPLINPPGTGGTPGIISTPGTVSPGTSGTVAPGTTGTTRPGTTATTSRSGTTGTTTRTATGGGATEPRRSERVALLDVFTQRGHVMASVRVNDTVYRVGEGETFAGNYKVVSLSASTECGRFLFGDSQFRLCRGEETLK
jgi:ABC-type cobalt transport system substrate-binding protein